MIPCAFAFLQDLGIAELMFLLLLSLPFFSSVGFLCLNSAGQSCLARSFKAEVSTCPNCRHQLKKDDVEVNKLLQDVLLDLFPGYEGGR